MRIEFDAGNATELSAVFVAIAVLRGGDLSLPLLDDDTVPAGIGAAPPAPPVAAVPPAPPVAPPVAPPIAAVAESLPPPAAPPAAPVAAAPAGVEVDAEGLPYDKRIHSSPASKKKDGKWRGKRGLDDATRQAVTAELKQAMAAPAPAASPVPPPMFEEAAPGVPLPPTEPPVDAATAFGAGAATPAPSVPPAPPVAAVAVPPAPPVAAAEPVVPAPPAAPPVPAGPAADFAGLMRKITGLQSAGHLTIQQTTEISQSLGITGVRDLMHRPDLIPSFDALLPVAA